MICIRETVIVEGKYDKMKLQSFINAPIIETNGFRIFKDKEKQQMIRRAAQARGLLVITDSDSAGFVIRNFLRAIVPPDKIRHCYIPQIAGKERRKDSASKEGYLGVEGLSEDIILDALKKCGAALLEEDCAPENTGGITKSDLYELGLTGKADSSALRKALLQKLGFPQYLSTNAMLSALNCICTKQELLRLISDIQNI